MIIRNNYINIINEKVVKQRFFSIEEFLVHFEKSLKKHKGEIINDKIFKHFEFEFKKVVY